MITHPSTRTCSHSQVDVPFPMHIGIDETPTAGPGDCHIKGGYVSGATTWTVKLACVSFYKNKDVGLPPGGGIFIVMNAKNGAPLAVIQGVVWGRAPATCFLLPGL